MEKYLHARERQSNFEETEGKTAQEYARARRKNETFPH